MLERNAAQAGAEPVQNGNGWLAGRHVFGAGDPGETTIPLDPPGTPTVPPTPEEPPAPVEPPPVEDPIGNTANSNIPRFAEVPESAKWPAGPYRQAPSVHGGEWWLTSPFTGAEPWLTQGGLTPSYGPPAAADFPDAPPEFLELFGPPPGSTEGTHRMQGSTEMAQWLIDLEHFQGTGVPEGFSQDQLDRAGDLFESWGMGRPIFYEGRYGWKARFPESGMPGFEAAPFTAIEAPHLVVAQYQVKMTQQGDAPAERHPFVPPQVFGGQPMDA